MKKMLALVLSLVMAFSLVAIPVSAAQDTIGKVEEAVGDIKDDASSAIESGKDLCDSLKGEDLDATIGGVFDFAEALIKAIHTLIHSLSELCDFDCPFCDEIDDEDADNKDDADDGETPDAPLYETAGTVIGEAFANKDMSFSRPYPQNVDAAYVVTVPLKSLAIDTIATYNVKTAIILEKDAVVGKIVFTDNDSYNYFHAVEGFKLIINNSGVEVPVVLKGEVRVGNTVITAANIGDYIEGPYSVHLA